MFHLGIEPRLLVCKGQGVVASQSKPHGTNTKDTFKKRVSRLGLVCLLSNTKSKCKWNFCFSFKDLWLDYIKEELNHPQGKPENCGSIHWRAMKMLQGDLVEDFVSKYTLLQTGHL